MNPTARRIQLIVREVIDEIVLYDLRLNQGHSLNPVTAFVWKHADGTLSADELVRLVVNKFAMPEAEPQVWESLDKLSREFLLEEQVDLEQRRIFPREILRS